MGIRQNRTVTMRVLDRGYLSSRCLSITRYQRTASTAGRLIDSPQCVENPAASRTTGPGVASQVATGNNSPHFPETRRGFRQPPDIGNGCHPAVQLDPRPLRNWRDADVRVLVFVLCSPIHRPCLSCAPVSFETRSPPPETRTRIETVVCVQRCEATAVRPLDPSPRVRCSDRLRPASRDRRRLPLAQFTPSDLLLLLCQFEQLSQ
jgi:hypothetical protein